MVYLVAMWMGLAQAASVEEGDVRDATGAHQESRPLWYFGVGPVLEEYWFDKDWNKRANKPGSTGVRVHFEHLPVVRAVGGGTSAEMSLPSESGVRPVFYTSSARVPWSNQQGLEEELNRYVLGEELTNPVRIVSWTHTATLGALIRPSAIPIYVAVRERINSSNWEAFLEPYGLVPRRTGSVTIGPEVGLLFVSDWGSQVSAFGRISVYSLRPLAALGIDQWSMEDLAVDFNGWGERFTPSADVSPVTGVDVQYTVGSPQILGFPVWVSLELGPAIRHPDRINKVYFEYLGRNEAGWEEEPVSKAYLSGGLHLGASI